MTMRDLRWLIKVFGKQAKIVQVKQTLHLIVDSAEKKFGGTVYRKMA